MKSKIHTLFAVVALLGLTGCGGVKFSSAFNAAQQVSSASNAPQTNAQVPACVLNNADYTLNEKLIDFEIVSQTNIDFGFNILSGLLKAFGLNIATKSGKMTMELDVSNTLSPNDTVATAGGSASSNSDNFSFNLGIWQIGVNGGYFYQTPLSTLTANTIKNGLSNLRAQFNSQYSGWSSRVVWTDAGSEQYVIPDGKVAGIRLNDEFAIYNVDYQWSGTPCQSNLVIVRRTSVLPVAVATVIQVDDNASVLQVVARNSEDPVQVGAQVVPSSLPLAAGETQRVLNDSLKIGTLANTTLAVQDSTPVDLSPFLTAQTQMYMTDYHWYPRK